MAGSAGKDLPLEVAGSLLVPAIRLPRDYGKAEDFARLVREAGVAGFIVFGGDPEIMPPFLERLVAEAGRPLLVMADYERGAGRMVPGLPELPPAMALGAAQSPELAYMAGKITALSARSLGVNVVLAPVLDLLTCLDNPIIGTRAFSDDPDLTSALGLAFVEGVQEEGLIACVKHFPGHGDTLLDSHTALPRVTTPREVLERREFVPFRAAVRGGVGMVMPAHVVYEEVDADAPATYSRPLLQDLLRRDWGFGGLVVSDALRMAGALGREEHPAVEALASGVDLLLYPEDPWEAAAAVQRAVREGALDAESIELARGRLALALGDLLCEAPAPRDLSVEYGFAVAECARRSITLLSDPDGLRARVAAGGAAVKGIVVDDDTRPERARLFSSVADLLDGPAVHVTAEGTGETGDLATALRRADFLILALCGDVGVAKERAGLHPALVGFARTVLEEHAEKTIVVACGGPFLLTGLPARTVVLAWGDGEASRRAALTAVFEGSEMPGRLPVRAG